MKITIEMIEGRKKITLNTPAPRIFFKKKYENTTEMSNKNKSFNPNRKEFFTAEPICPSPSSLKNLR